MCALQVKEMQVFRLSLPEDAKIVICKNTLMRIAADRVDGWSDLKEATNVRLLFLPIGAPMGAAVQFLGARMGCR